MLAGDYEGVILTTCCDSIRRLYDVLTEELPDRFIYILDTPRITKDAGVTLYEKRIWKMIRAYEAFSGKHFEEEKLAELLKTRQKEQAISLKEHALNIVSWGPGPMRISPESWRRRGRTWPLISPAQDFGENTSWSRTR